MWISILISTSMIALGVLAWRVIQRREAGDPELERRWRADERRAKAARERSARERRE